MEPLSDHWKQKIKDWSTSPPDLDELDPGIRALVKQLWQEGFETVSSCEGSEGHAFNLPTVIVRSWRGLMRSGGVALKDRLASFILKTGRTGFSVSEIWLYQSKPRPWKHGGVKVELWSAE